MNITKSVSDIFLSIDDIKDKEVKSLLEENDIDEIMVDIDDIDVDVDLDDFDEDDLIEHLENNGYEVIERESRNHPYVMPSSYSVSMDHIEQIKDILQLHCYDSRFIRLMLEEIAQMPMGCDIDSLMGKVRSMCS